MFSRNLSRFLSRGLGKIQSLLEKEEGPFVAVSDFMKIVPEQIAQWVPGGLTVLGTDGFGRSDTRPRLRRFFEVDAESTVIATLYALAKKGEIEKSVVEDAIKDISPVSPTPIPANQGGTKDLQLALDALFTHQNTGPFISKLLIQRLVTSNPSPASPTVTR